MMNSTFSKGIRDQLYEHEKQFYEHLRKVKKNSNLKYPLSGIHILDKNEQIVVLAINVAKINNDIEFLFGRKCWGKFLVAGHKKQ